MGGARARRSIGERQGDPSHVAWRREWDRHCRRHMALPAGFLPGGRRFATLRDVLAPDVATVDGDQLTADQLRRLTISRIRRQRQFKFSVLGEGPIGKARAIAAVREGSSLGEFFLLVERKTIELARESFGAGAPGPQQLRDLEASVEGRRRRR
jgi:hypothetical protein